MVNFLPNEVIRALSKSDKLEDYLLWGEEGDKFLRRNAYRGLKWLAAAAYVSLEAVQHRAERIGVSIPRIDPKKYAALEKQIILDASPAETAEIAERIFQKTGRRRSQSSVEKKRRELGIKYESTWASHPERTAYLKEKYSVETIAEIAKHLGLREKQVERKAENLGLRRYG